MATNGTNKGTSKAKKPAKGKASANGSGRAMPHLCIERIVPDEYNPARATTARAILRAAPPGVLSLALPRLKMWENGSTITCCFLDGSPTQRAKVEKYAKVWEDHANLTLKFVRGRDAQVRISFVADTGSWSAVGTDALVERYFPKYQPTMNFGWLHDDTDDDEYSRVVTHEFGHAIGCIHEHQSPKATLKWNKAEVYRVFSGAPNFWSKADIDHNVLERASKMSTNAGTFDGKSIMLYEFPASLFLDGKGTASNRVLSAGDKAFIKQMYPKKK